MAIITCPHCGKNISDKADSCVHCGAELASASDAERQSTVNSVDYIQMFNDSSPDIKRKKDKLDTAFKLYDKFEWIFYIIFIGLLALYYYLTETTDFLKSLGGSALVLFTIFIISAAISVLKFIKNDVFPYLYSVECSKWISKNNIDAMQFIKDRYIFCIDNADTMGITDDLFNFSKGVLLASDSKAYSKIKVHLIIRAAVRILFALWFALAIPLLSILPKLLSPTISAGAYILKIITIGVSPLIGLIILRIVLHFALEIPDRKRVSSLYVPK